MTIAVQTAPQLVMTPELELSNVDVFYGKAQVLFDLSICVEKGKVVSIIGANGAGKSTTLNLIVGRLKPTKGTVRFGGRITAGHSVEQIIASGIACVPQRRRIFGTMTVMENLEVGSYVKRGDKGAVSAARDEVFELFPVLKKKATMMGGVLSGGEQQMLAIGRGLMACPKLLLLDEPSMGLSPKLTLEMFRDVKRIAAGGRTVVIVEQNAYAALGVSDYGYVLEGGRVALEGPAQALLKDNHVRDAYLGA
ncbi:amino acid/amide ABC transporter ATP-binding protein 2 (HAAT family) [Rhizobium sp. ERR 1071]|uniref:ABC transporter ATP-binding protein n=1 Tax=Rhizobium sp. ERR 1071 TaxID=2572677 RepID=UPI0011991ACF|nr:ABC transporter ATP-binding protein [Rhizobium sp. ERR1071]TWB12200.1 amino acid/amide ABC transporter ATP-binding protein 2 (HAAT family) [Rhizobium sp. ERR1071]